MLDPDLVLDAVVAAFQSIPTLNALMKDDAGVSTIVGHYFSYGEENSLLRAVYSAPSPSIIVAYMDLLGGNFDGMTVFKHRLEAYIRPKNTSPDLVSPGPSTPHIWWMMMNLPALGSATRPIRSQTFMSGALQIMDTPTLIHRQDETGADFFVGSMTFPEAGDV